VSAHLDGGPTGPPGKCQVARRSSIRPVYSGCKKNPRCVSGVGRRIVCYMQITWPALSRLSLWPVNRFSYGVTLLRMPYVLTSCVNCLVLFSWLCSRVKGEGNTVKVQRLCSTAYAASAALLSQTEPVVQLRPQINPRDHGLLPTAIRSPTVPF